MLKKSLISAALVALSSTSAFADTESFSIGVKGLYFMPYGESKPVGPDLKIAGVVEGVKVAPEGQGFFMPGVQFMYSLSDMVRVGVAAHLGFNEFTKSFPGTPKSSGTTPAPKDTPAPKECKSKLTEKLSPKATFLALIEPKLYENDFMSLSLTAGLGTTLWNHSFSLEDEADSNIDLKSAPNSTQASTFALSGMGLINLAFGLGDVATLTISGGYAGLGHPKGFAYGKSKEEKEIPKLNPEEVRYHGWIAGIGLSKDF